MTKPVALIIMDGYAHGKDYPGNAITQANTPNLDKYYKEYPNTEISTSGMAVGLPDGQMGNSEVGHLNIGAGRIVYQSLTRINVAIDNGDFYKNEALVNAVINAKKNNSKLHLLGLFSEGGVHSHINHFIALVELAKQNDVDVYVHAFTDGRDVLPRTSKDDFAKFEKTLAEMEHGKIASVVGRFYAMDRDNIWERTQVAYDLLVHGKGEKFSTIDEAVTKSYDNDVTDEFIKPSLIAEEGLIEDNDSVVFVNFRPDRAIQLSTMLTNIAETPNEDKQLDLEYVCMMHYAEKVKGSIAFGLQDLKDTYGEVISGLGLKQLRIAETQKYAHVTFFFDGGLDKEIEGSTRVLVDSPKVATFDEVPEMSAYEVAEKAVEEISTGKYDTIILNFANCDMVGHTGIMPAAIKAVEVVDECVGKVVDAINAQGGVALITADHGNADQLLDENGNTFTAHTTNPVPMILTKSGYNLRSGGNLGDLAPTMLELLGIDQPAAMTGKSLIERGE